MFGRPGQKGEPGFNGRKGEIGDFGLQGELGLDGLEGSLHFFIFSESNDRTERKNHFVFILFRQVLRD